MTYTICNCCPPYENGCAGQPPPVKCGDPYPSNCCSYTAESPVIVISATGSCYCCCGGSRAFDTHIAVASGQTKLIEELLVGDAVYVALDPRLTKWDEIPVQFSSGTGGESNSSMIHIRFGDAAQPESVIAARNQLFLLPGQVLKRASTLVPGQDQLMRPDGTSVPILNMVSGEQKRSLHVVSTGTGKTTDLSGHLIIVNGVVCADYSLQLADLETVRPDLMAGGAQELPEFDSKEYAERYPHRVADTFKAEAPTQIN